MRTTRFPNQAVGVSAAPWTSHFFLPLWHLSPDFWPASFRRALRLERPPPGVALALLASVGVAAFEEASALTSIMLLLTGFVAAVVLGFSRRYMRADPDRTGYASKVAWLAAAVMTFVASGNVMLFAVAWVASGLLLAACIGHVRDWPDARRAARRALLAFAIGDAALIVALVLLALHADSLDIAVLAQGQGLSTGLASIVAVLLLVAAMARSALPPFAGWLLGSMTAPTPVSALMHAGLVNAGGFLLIRFAMVMEAAPLVQGATIIAGLVAAIWGTAVLLVRPDVKRALAGSTVAQMGFMLLSCGLTAYAAALWHLVAHGMFKAWLFLASGSAIGVESDPALAKPSARGTVAIATLALAATTAVGIVGTARPEALPLLLGIATGVAALVALIGTRFSGRSLLAVAMLAAANFAGLWLVESVLPRPFGAIPGGGLTLVVVALTLLAAWAAAGMA